MASINRRCLLDDLLLYLPDEQTLSLNALSQVSDSLIRRIGDDDKYYSEVLCKALRNVAIIHKSKSVTASALKREERGGIEVEFFNVEETQLWDDYIDSLKDLCPILPGGGYSFFRGVGAFISSGEVINITDCDDKENLTL